MNVQQKTPHPSTPSPGTLSTGTQNTGAGPATPSVIVLGAGVAGLCTAIQLKKMGVSDITIFEKSGAVGGTWRDNVYPGSGCDVPSHLYSFSFEPNWDWSRKFGLQHEIEEYLNHCADKYDVRRHIRFNTEVTDARFDEATGLWHVCTADGEERTANVLVSGVGQLNRPAYPNIPGLDDFKGIKFHSARWDHTQDLAGKRIAVIGNGASAIQFVPEIAPKVKQIHIFQRSANWIVPKPDRLYSSTEHKIYRLFPWLVRLHRYWLYLMHERNFLAFIKDHWFGNLFKKAFHQALDEHIQDPKLKEVLTPDYPVGCKRILLTNDWLPTMARDNVEVVTAPIERVTVTGVVAADGAEREVDAIIYATGFEATDFLSPINIEGRDGRTLNQAWKDGAEAHRGIALSGFPNFFMLYGPNTNLGHNSIIFMIECQVNYIKGCITRLKEHGLAYMDVKKDAMTAFNAQLQQDIAKSVWATSCTSWYKTGAGKVTNNWSSFTLKYWWQTRAPNPAEFNETAWSELEEKDTAKQAA